MTKVHCQICGETAAQSYDGWVLCEKCTSRSQEYDQRWEEYQAGLITWNTSQHDPFWREWLLSRELFDVIRSTVPGVGQKIHSILGGDVFEYGRDTSCWVQVWLAPGEVLVAYPSFSERYNSPVVGDGPHEFEEWILDLRNSPPLELGEVRGRCSYGAAAAPEGPSVPVVKWAQAGDWAALARNWYAESRGVPAPWP